MIEIKSSSVTLPMLRLLGSDVEKISEQLAEKIEMAPDFFRNAPVVIDLHELANKHDDLDFQQLVPMLIGYGMNPVGVRGGNSTLNEAARSAELAVLADGRTEPKRSGVEKKVPKHQPKAKLGGEKPSISRIITQPIRSGQKIYAAGADLIIISQVSHGAEIMADGNIHVYGTLRGRALAGVTGNLDSRIFCYDLKAELISIGGHYKISENLDDSLSGKPVQVFLSDELLKIEPI